LYLAAIAGLLIAGAGAGRLAHGATAVPVPSTGALRICTSCDSTGGDLSHYGYVILNSWDAPMIPALKAQNPGLKALVYKNLSFTTTYTCASGADLALIPDGVGYCDTNANHPEWFLTDTSGHRIASAYFPQAYMLDVGNQAYQDRWLANVTADLRAGGWDGVFMDDTNTSMAWHLNGRTIAKYPTDSAWRGATRSMLARVGPGLTSAGFLAVPNLSAPWGADYDAQATWRDWIQFTSGAAQEYYTKWGTTSSSWFANSDWTYRQAFQTITEQAGKIFLGITYAPKADGHSALYARANFLLFDDPANRGALMYEPSDPEAQDPYAPQWTSDIGSPLAPRFQVGSVWRRNYSGGTVLVNPSSSTVTVALDQPYVGESGAQVTSVTLGATSGAVLRSTATAPSPSPAPPTPPPPPPPAGTIQLSATIASATRVELRWSGMTSSRTEVWRNGVRVATIKNTGYRLDKLGSKAVGTLTYRVCVPHTTTCSATVSVTFGLTALSDPTVLPRYSPAHLKSRVHLHRHATRRHVHLKSRVHLHRHATRRHVHLKNRIHLRRHATRRHACSSR